MSLKFIFIQLNEINFDLVKKYLLASKDNKYKNLKIVINNFKNFHTFAESEYQNLEPWIQWASFNLGKRYSDHKIFRLGDIVKFPGQKQIFEKIEERGFKVGAVSPMNADNRLNNPSYFIADPWTDTHSDNSSFSKRLSSMLKQTVNDNSSGNLSLNSILTILEVILKTFSLKKTFFLINLIFSSLFKTWKKSLVLDYLIHLIHLYLFEKNSPNFSSVFFNAGAHIQHHYFFNSKQIKNLPKNPEWYIASSLDPIENMLEIYDRIIGDYLKLCKNKDKLVISTGLTQLPYKEIEYYYRLKNHHLFLKKICINFLKVLPRMTRDFEIIFDNKKDLIKAKNILQNIKSKKNNLNIFSEIEERERSLFVVLTYFHKVEKNDVIIINEKVKLNFFNEVVFVAIKNGMHNSKGYVFCSPGTYLNIPKKPIHISKLHDIVLSYF